MPRSSTSAERAVLVIVGLVAGLCIAEGVARVVPDTFGDANFALAGAGNRPECVRPSLSRGYEPIPGTCGTDAEGARDYTAGLSGVPVRVMVVGDSLSTLGTWPAALAEALAAGWQGSSVTVETYGVPGYNACQELSMFRETVATARPDVVVLQSCANDVQGSPVLVQAGGWVSYFSDNAVVEFPEVLLRSRLLTTGVLALAPRTPMVSLGSGKAMAATCLRELHADAAGLGVELVAVLFPLFCPSDAPALTLVDEVAMRRLLAESTIPFLDLRPAYEAAGPMLDHRDRPADFIHPSRGGEQVAAKAIAAWMLGAVQGR